MEDDLLVGLANRRGFLYRSLTMASKTAQAFLPVNFLGMAFQHLIVWQNGYCICACEKRVESNHACIRIELLKVCGPIVIV